MAFVSSKTDSISSASAQLLGENNSTTELLPLNKCGSGLTINHTLPSTGNYFYQIQGVDTEASPFSFLIPRSVALGSGVEYYTFEGIGNDTIEGNAEDFIFLTFRLSSTNPYGPSHFQFTVQELPGFSRNVLPSQATLSAESGEVNVTVVVTAVSNVESGSSYVVTASASNGCSTLTASKTIVVIVPVSRAIL